MHKEKLTWQHFTPGFPFKASKWRGSIVRRRLKELGLNLKKLHERPKRKKPRQPSWSGACTPESPNETKNCHRFWTDGRISWGLYSLQGSGKKVSKWSCTSKGLLMKQSVTDELSGQIYKARTLRETLCPKRWYSEFRFPSQRKMSCCHPIATPTVCRRQLGTLEKLLGTQIYMVEGAWLHLTNPLISGIWHFEILIRWSEETNYRPTCFSPNLGTAVMNSLPIGLWRWRLKKLSFSQRQRLPRRRLKNQRLGWILNSCLCNEEWLQRTET